MINLVLKDREKLFFINIIKLNYVIILINMAFIK